MVIDTRIFKLKLKHSFGISRNTYNYSQTIVVSLQNGAHIGIGEAAENVFYHITVELMERRAEELSQWFLQYQFTTPEQLWEDLHPQLIDMPFLQCAIDIAAHDLYGKMLGKPLYQIWGLSPDNLIQTNFTIGIDTIDKMISKLQEQPWPLYKIKLGTPNDLKIISELRKHTDATFRIDANTGWTVEETLRNAVTLKQLGVEFIEQPLADDNWEGAEQLYQQSVLPIIADESCKTIDDIEKCYKRFHGVNIKLVKCGGLTPARKMIKMAKKLGLKTMVGCMVESSIGISAIGQLVPYLDYVDMDGALLIQNDMATGVRLVNGNIILNELPGIGASIL